MSRMDWVPCRAWGAQQSVPALTQGDLELMNIADSYGTAEVVGLIEASPVRYFVHRIVGMIQVWSSGTPAAGDKVWTRIWPGFVETEVVPTLITVDFIDEADGANARMWYQRIRSLPRGEGDDIGADNHPWWTSVDITPKQVIDKYMVPALSVFNDSATVGSSFRHYLRMLVTPLE